MTKPSSRLTYAERCRASRKTQVARVCRAIADGGDLKDAARAGGLGIETLHRWLNADGAFRRRLKTAAETGRPSLAKRLAREDAAREKAAEARRAAEQEARYAAAEERRQMEMAADRAAEQQRRGEAAESNRPADWFDEAGVRHSGYEYRPPAESPRERRPLPGDPGWDNGTDEFNAADGGNAPGSTMIDIPQWWLDMGRPKPPPYDPLKY